MKIAFAIKAMDDASGGAERVLSQVSAGLADRGHRVSLVTFDPPGGRSFFPLNAKIKRMSLGIGQTSKKSTLKETIIRIFSLRKALVADRPDVVIAFMHSMFIPMAIALAGTGIPVIASEHTVPSYYRDKEWELRLFRWCMRFLHTVTVVSAAAKDLFPKKMQEKMVVIPNPVKRPPANYVADPGVSHIILSVGRLEPVKNHETLIKAFACIAPLFPDWRVRIVGEGSRREVLADLIEQLGLSDRVILVGARQDVSAEYAQAGIFAVPSYYESFGLVTAEAALHGLPSVGFKDCSGTNELILHDKTGLLISREDEVTSLAEALESLIRDSKKRKSFGASARAGAGGYELEPVLDQWEHLIDGAYKVSA